MLTHTIRDIEWRCADYTFSLGIVCTQARKLFDLSSTGLEIAIVISFFENFLEFLKKKKNTVILKILKISEKSDGRFTVKYFKFL